MYDENSILYSEKFSENYNWQLVSTPEPNPEAAMMTF